MVALSDFQVSSSIARALGIALSNAFSSDFNCLDAFAFQLFSFSLFCVVVMCVFVALPHLHHRPFVCKLGVRHFMNLERREM